jgi:hypothetical protein
MRLVVILAIALAAITPVAPMGARTVEACAGLIGSNGDVQLARTTTLAAYADGVEHYVTAFEFQGGGGEFGSLIPLPGVPSKIERGGDWTLQRLLLETEPERVALPAALAEAPLERAEVLQEVRIDALDLTVLSGGAAAVAAWATEHGFRLPADAPEVLDFYARRSPIFLAAVFDGKAAAERGQALGDGTPVHLTIPTSDPWVPLRILALGKQPADRVEADVFLLTENAPSLLPLPGEGMALTHSAPASEALLNDLRSDKGMEWLPASAWLTKLEISISAGDLRYDLAVDASGSGSPSRVAAGFDLPGELASLATEKSAPESAWVAWVVVAFLAAVALRLRPFVRRTRR